jgi:hypothetical protein
LIGTKSCRASISLNRRKPKAAGMRSLNKSYNGSHLSVAPDLLCAHNDERPPKKKRQRNAGADGMEGLGGNTFQLYMLLTCLFLR